MDTEEDMDAVRESADEENSPSKEHGGERDDGGGDGSLARQRKEKVVGWQRRAAQFRALLDKNLKVKFRGAIKWATLLELILPTVFFVLLTIPRFVVDVEYHNPTLYPVRPLGSFRWGQTCPLGHTLRVTSGEDAGAPGEMGEGMLKRLVCGSQYGRPESSIEPPNRNVTEAVFEIAVEGATGDVEQAAETMETFIEENPSNFLLIVSVCNGIRMHYWDLLNAMYLLLEDNFKEACSAKCQQDNSCQEKYWRPLFDGQARLPFFESGNGLLQAHSTEEDAVSAAVSDPLSTLAIVNVSKVESAPSYTMRMNASGVRGILLPGEEFASRFSSVSPPEWWSMTYPFVNVQHAIESTLVERASGQEVSVNATLKQQPWLAYQLNMGSVIAATFLAIVVALAFSSSSVLILKSVVQEKELRLREGMRVMGMTDGMFWVSWFVTHWSSLALTSFVCALISIYPFPNTDWTVNLVFFLLWTANLVAFNYFLSAFFDNSRLAATIGWFVYVLSIAPSVGAQALYPGGATVQTWATALPASAMHGYGALLGRLEVSQRGLTWNTIGENAVDNGTFRGRDIMILTLAQLVIFAILAWYFDNVWPSRFGRARSPLFFLTVEYWLTTSTKKRRKAQVKKGTFSEKNVAPEFGSEEYEGDDRMEQLYPGKETFAAIKIRSLCKRFSRGLKPAVDGVTVSFPRGEIGSLLGHNGAGKTTTFNILSGQLEPTSGDAFMHEIGVSEDIDKIREQDVLWPMLTPFEHLQLFAMFAGVPKTLAYEAAHNMLTEVNLDKKRNDMAFNLSGGQKRKLSLALAFVGSPRISLLDEPTSGMDPSARRFAWSIIRAQRKHMSILMTTHFLDEADALSDRVCILNEGRVAAFGSPVFLKDRFGEGYHLTVDWSGDTSDVAGIVKTHIPGALLTEDIRTELRFRLPKGSISLLSGLLERLESHRKVLSYGMSGPTLEDVFLDAGQKDSEDGAKDSESRRDELMKSLARKRREAREGDDCQRISAFALVWKQFQCLFVKRVRVFMRQWASLILQLVIPSFFLIIALALGELAGNSPVNSLGPRPITRNEFLQGMQGAFAQGSDCGSCAWISDHHPESLRLDALTEVGYLTPCACFCPTEYQVEEDDFFSIQRGCSEVYSNRPEACVDVEIGNKTATVNKDGFVDAAGAECEEAFPWTIDAELLTRQEALTPCNEEPNGVCDALFSLGEEVEAGRKVHHFVILPNPTAFWASTVLINEVNSVVFAKEAGMAQTRIKAINHPLPRLPSEGRADVDENLPLLVTILVALGASVLSASYSIQLAWERASNAKHLQIVSGVSKNAYWLSHFVVDFATYAVPFGAFMFVFYIFNSILIAAEGSLEAVAVLLVLFGWASIPLAYALHFFFTSEMNAFVGQLSGYGFLSFGFLLSGIILETLQSEDQGARITWGVLRWIWGLLPHYSLGKGLFEIMINSLKGEVHVAVAGEKRVLGAADPFEMDIAGQHMVYLAVLGVVFFGITLVCDHWNAIKTWLHQWRFYLNRGSRRYAMGFRSSSQVHTEPYGENADHEEEEEEGVSEDKMKVKNPGGEERILVHDLAKVYANGNAAVKGISWAVDETQCFGLLGLNGSGKSTTFKTITGEHVATRGDAYVRSQDSSRLFSVTREMNQARKGIGYCPQQARLSAYPQGKNGMDMQCGSQDPAFEIMQDAVQPTLTPRELLHFYAHIRGMPDSRINSAVDSLLRSMRLFPFADRQCSRLSGGNKRKLCVAIALVGDPLIVLLDEPTSGVDPEAQRFLWSCIMSCMPGRSIVLTSHSMRECEVLCSKVGILVGGKFRCMGPVQRIKAKYGGKSYLDFGVTSRLEATSLCEWVRSLDPGAEVVEIGERCLSMSTDARGARLAGMLEHIEASRCDDQVRAQIVLTSVSFI